MRFQNETDVDNQGVSGDLGDATPALRFKSQPRNEAFARAPVNCDDRDGALIGTRRPKVKFVETGPLLTDTYRKKRLRKESKGEPSKLDTAARIDGDPSNIDADGRVESNLTLMWKARECPSSVPLSSVSSSPVKSSDLAPCASLLCPAVDTEPAEDPARSQSAGQCFAKSAPDVASNSEGPQAHNNVNEWETARV